MNESIHYGMGMRIAICGAKDHTRLETNEAVKVTCPDCRKIVKKRMPGYVAQEVKR